MADEKNVRRVNVWWLLLTSGLTVAAVILAIAMIGYRSDVQSLENELWGYQIEKSQAEEEEKRAEEKQRMQEVQKQAQEKRRAEMWPRSPSQPYVLTPDELAAITAKGLTDPYKDLIADILKHHELIPEDGVLGGTMRFFAGDRTIVLGPDRVLAEYDDGHIGGQALFQYEVGDSGEIKWQCLSYLKEQ